MRIGPPRNYEHKQSLYDHSCEMGGTTGMSDWPIPDECVDFIVSQFHRFNVPFAPCVNQIIERAAAQCWYFIDVTDPYSILLMLSDIGLTDEWQRFTYEVRGRNDLPVECDPEEIESFKYIPGQAEHWFNYFLSNPGLEAIPYGVGTGLEWELDYIIEDPVSHFDSDWLAIDAFVGDKFKNYLELAMWGAFVWLAGPLGRDYRMDGHMLFDACITHGEAILCDGNVLAPKDYRKIQRPPQSCYKCGLDSWCSEIIEFEGVTRFVCEYCLNNGAVLYPGANCGSRVCKYVECPRHIHHNKDRTLGLYQTMRSSGQFITGSQRTLIA